jgi:hypothetical protein|tara:strand:- start:945 stop:2363 length:1419 start_codon:yes stop_codon:yes gene_type:complete
MKKLINYLLLSFFLFVITNTLNAQGLAAGSIHWVEKANDGTNIESIVRTDLDGSDKTAVYLSPAWDVQNFGSNLQVTSSSIYWVEKANDGTGVEYILSTDLSGLNKTVLYESPAYAVQNFGSNLQVSSSNIYWVEKANDGTGIECIVSTDLNGLNKTFLYESPAYAVQNFGSNLQVTGSNIFWAEKANDGTSIEYIVRTDLDGSNKISVVSNVPFAYNPNSDFGDGPAYTFIVTPDNLYWIENKNGGKDIMRSDLDGSNLTTLYTSPQYDVQNFGSNLQVTGSNIYWVEKANDGTSVEYIVSTDLNGSNKTVLYESPAWDVQNFGSNLQVTLALVNGCTDASAYNYNASATDDDTSCVSWIDYSTAQSLEIENLQQQLEEALLGQEQHASIDRMIDIPEGWSMFGYTCSDSVNVALAFQEYEPQIEIIKDDLGLAWLIEYGYNALGSLQYGKGYQIKTLQEIENFQFCPNVE